MARFIATTGVGYVRPELRAMLGMYSLIQDCIEGSEAVKRNARKYLPKPDPDNDSEDNNKRYKDYVTRAVFYNLTRRTLYGLMGQIFIRDPQSDIPTELEMMLNDADGAGVTLEQVAKKACLFTISFGRAGLLADYPQTQGVVTKAQVDAGTIRPALRLFPPSEIINWRTVTIGGKVLLSLVVIAEFHIVADDGFEHKTQRQFRVLRLTQGTANVSSDGDTQAVVQDETFAGAASPVYNVEIWREQVGGFAIHQTFVPTDASGKTFDHIPFTFIGSDNNDCNPDNPPLFDLADLNIGHFRNSADYEESLFTTGQATLVMTGMTQEWYEKVLERKVKMGARSAIPLPVGAQAVLLQPQPNSMPFEGMQAKERQAVALGAKLVEQKSVQRTAFEANLENTAANTALSTIANNVAAAIEWALGECLKFVTTGETKIEYELNDEYDLTKMSPEERRQLVQEWQAGAIMWTEMRSNMKRAGIATEDDDVARKAINAEVADSLATIGVAPGQTPTPAANDPGADPNPSKFDAGKPGNRTLGTGG